MPHCKQLSRKHDAPNPALVSSVVAQKLGTTLESSKDGDVCLQRFRLN